MRFGLVSRDDGAPNDFFGYAVSISGDASTVAIGVPYKYTNSLQTGAVYVFVKPNDFEGGWNSIYPIRYKAKLLASDGATIGRRLGWSVTPAAMAERSWPERGASRPRRAPPTSSSGLFQRLGNLSDSTQYGQADTHNESHWRESNLLWATPTISGDAATIAVGAPDVQVNSDLGAVYVFLRAAAGWIDANETQKIPGPAAAQYGQRDRVER